MIGVIVKKDGKVIEKNSLAGDEQKNFAAVVKLQSENTDKEYICYNDKEMDEFNSIQVENREGDLNKEWSKLKSKATEVEIFLAKVLGLDA